MSLEDPVAARSARRLTYRGFAFVVIGYLAIIQLGGLVIGKLSGLSSTSIVSSRDVLVNLWIPLGGALLFTYAVVTALHWWRPVLRDDRPVRRWLWVVPAVFAVGILAAIDYGALAQKGIGYVLLLLIATQFVGWGEEGMFRGIGVTVLRQHGLTEGKVALWSSIIFGAVHLTNAIGHGASAIPQAIAVSAAGYFFYLIRRVSRGNVVNSVLHGLFDFSIISGTSVLVDQKTYPPTASAIGVYVVLAVVLLIRRRHIEPTSHLPVAPPAAA